MASRGTPLPWKVRQQLRELEDAGHSRKVIAFQLGLSMPTIRKYLGRKFFTFTSQGST